jgi:predicted nucleotidyltransferase
MAQATAPVAIPDIQKLAEQIVDRLKPCRVILFGSYASGMPTADSDVDLLVVMRDPPAWREAFCMKSEWQSQFPATLQIHFMESRQFEETRNVIGGIAYPAAHNGKLLYEQNS